MSRNDNQFIIVDTRCSKVFVVCFTFTFYYVPLCFFRLGVALHVSVADQPSSDSHKGLYRILIWSKCFSF